MFAVIFEVQPRPERFDDYLDIAKRLRAELQATAGFIEIDRFASTRTKGRVLSLSTWRDEKAVIRWRTHAEHHAAQERGRGEIFQDYRLRVGEVMADTRSPAGLSLEQQRFDATEVGDAKVVTVTDVTVTDVTVTDAAVAGATASAAGTSGAPPGLASDLGLDRKAPGLVDCEAFESIYQPGRLVLLASWRDADAARAWMPGTSATGRAARHRHVRIIRDYGMFERYEAPQYYPEVERPGAQRDRSKRTAAG